MIKFYVKQAWQLMRQHPLFSSLYILGTALAICFTMVIVIAHYGKIAPIYPEYNRKHTLFLENSVKLRTADNYDYTYAVSYKALKEWFYPLKNAEAISGMTYSSDLWVQPEDKSGDFRIGEKLVDPAFFRIYQFKFLEGTPFSQADFESGIRQAVITDRLARKLFHTDQGIVGRNISLNFTDYRICGVVKSASPLATDSYAEVYLPYTVNDNYESYWHYEYLGAYTVTFLVKSRKQAAALNKEIQTLVKNINQQHKDEWKIDFGKKLATQIDSAMEGLAIMDTYKHTHWEIARRFLLIFLVLLLIPAINLSGMISSRMEERLPEMGVRKSFGASRKTLLRQVIWENLVLTLTGGALGLLLTWFVFYIGRARIFNLFSEGDLIPTDTDFTMNGELLFSPMVFICTLLVCVIMNILSALFPAWNSLRKPIVNSLNEKQ